VAVDIFLVSAEYMLETWHAPIDEIRVLALDMQLTYAEYEPRT